MRAVPIIRSRTGCFTCRRRKKKCNEEKPVCSGCKRNKLECTWPAELPAREQAQGQPRGRERAASTTSKPAASAAAAAATPVPRSPRPDDVQSPVSPALQRLQLTASPRHGSIGSEGVLPNDAESSAARRYSDGSSDGSSSRAGGDSVRNGDEMPDELDEAVSPASPLSSFGSLVALDVDAALQQRRMSDVSALSPFAFVSGRESFSGDGLYLHDNIPMNMSLLPSHGHDSFELLSYYLERTANSMGNGSTDINPFVAKLIPLAFFRPSGVASHTGAERGASAVIQAVARGDVRGTIFDHLAASKSLLTSLLSQSRPEASDDLPDFLVEYYMHMVACSMISKDARGGSQPALSPAIENAAKQLLDKNYTGQLCGSWLEMLTLIPQVFQLGQSMLRTGAASASPDDIITFGLLQSQILGFAPSLLASTSSQLAGLVFKQAALLYLWSIFGTPQQAPARQTMHGDLMNGAVLEAVALLGQLPASERVNTSLCWPLTVVGCCTTSVDVQQALRARLETMIDTIGLGNMRQTLALLEHVWEQDPGDISPWTLRAVMQRYEIWISFA
ncbi:Zn(2)-Cys(6) zinc finger domain protein [Metarhizium robertsii]|uniref:Zn(2)-Cys(6) zinc finger domain protein n=1 Tax=Metarhizium robertsii TaxID=568076 RepID=A0A0A1V5Q1_9HYPO|nr:Zn(2)-Cys(6) zinc finger domain protein [Metarhizium robertsii]